MYFRGTPYTFLGPTKPINCPFFIISPLCTIYVGDTWQYVNFVKPDVRVIVYPPPPRNPAYVISPSHTEYKDVPFGAPMSIPL